MESAGGKSNALTHPASLIGIKCRWPKALVNQDEQTSNSEASLAIFLSATCGHHLWWHSINQAGDVAAVVSTAVNNPDWERFRERGKGCAPGTLTRPPHLNRLARLTRVFVQFGDNNEVKKLFLVALDSNRHSL